MFGNTEPRRKAVSPMISVIIPTCQRRDLLMRAIDSVLMQTCRDLECIVVDDGSTDGTEEAVRALRDPRVRYVRQERVGAGAARNRGVDLALGEYIAFQDSDDVWHPDKLEKQLALLTAADADAVACAMVRDGQVFPAGVPEGPLTFDGLLFENLCSTQCLMGKAEVFRCVRFDEKMPRLQDWDLLLRLTGPYRLHFSPEPLVDVFVQPDSISAHPEKLHLALLRLYGKHHAAIKAHPDPLVARQWVRSIVQSAPENTDPWTPELLRIAPDWVYRPGMARLAGDISIHMSGQTPPDAHTTLRLDVDSFDPAKGGMYLPFSLLPEALQGASGVTFPGYGTGLAGALKALTAAKGRRAAWNVLASAYGAGAAAAELAAQALMDMPAWAKALQDLTLPESTGPVRRIGMYYHSLKNGGVQRVTAALARLFQDMGLCVTLITSQPADPADYAIPDGVRRLVIPALDPACPDTNRAHVTALHNAAGDLDLLLYSAWADPLILFDVLAVRGAGCRCLIHTHSVFTLPLLEQGLRDRFKALPAVYALASGVVTLSEADAAYWRHTNPRVFVTVNPLPFDPARTPVSSLSGRTILWAGRLSREKRPFDAIDVMARVVRRVPDAKLILLGGGDDALEAGLRRHIEACGLSDCVTLPGFQLDPAPWYARADVFLCTSAYEGFCLSMAEAQTFGVPCVTYDMPWLTVLQGGGHLSVPQDDTAAAADAVVRLLTDAPLRRTMGRAARENAETRLCPDQRALWQQILADMAQPAPAKGVPDAQSIMLTTLREHALRSVPAEHISAHPTVFVPLPEKGPCRRLRKKLATFLQVLLIDGPAGVVRVIREKHT